MPGLGRKIVAFGLVVSSLTVWGGAATRVSATSSSVKAFVPVNPVRLLDTRQSDSNSFGHDEKRDLRVSGVSAVPIAAVAVALNVTVTGPTGDGFLTMWPAGQPKPTVSNLNFVSGETVPNLVTIGVGSGGNVSLAPFLYQLSGEVDVIVDVVGWYAAGFNPINPTRIMDTRNGVNGFRLAPGETRTLRIVGTAGLPTTPVGSVALNVTVVNPTLDGGYLTIWPTGRDMPTASSLNFGAGETAANAVITGVGADGRISIFNFSGESEVLVDLAGWFDLGFDAMTPFRIVDTREMPGYPTLGPGETMIIPMVGQGEIPAEGVGAVAMNITVTGGTSESFLTIWPTGRPRPTASSLNFVAGQTIPNAVISGVGQGSISIYNESGSVDVIVDVTGWYALSDSEAPQLASFSLSSGSVDTSAAARTITVTARITDDLAGNAGAGYTSSQSQVWFRSPSGQSTYAMLTDPSAAPTVDQTYSYAMTIPRWSESGTWTLSYVMLVDQVGNMRTLDASQVAALGFPTSFQQVGVGDFKAPQLASFSLSSGSVDTSAAARTITVTARITDDLAGNAGAGYTSSQSQVSFRSPSGQSTFAMFTDVSAPPSVDQTYSYAMTIPRWSESGTWTLQSLMLVDQVGNMRTYDASQVAALGFPTSFQQVGVGDLTAPQLASFSLSPGSVNTSLGAQTITVTARITDDLAGNAGAGYTSSQSQVWFRSPSGQSTYAMFTDVSAPPSVDRTYSYAMIVPYLSESGTWTLQSLMLVDQVGNTRTYDASQVAALGFPTSFVNN